MLDRLIEVLLQFIDLFRFWIVLKPYEAGVVLRLGKFHRKIGPGGFHWLIPFNLEDYLYANVVPETLNTSPQSLTTKDEVEVVVASVVTFEINDIKKFLLEIEGANQVIEDATYGYISEFIRTHTWKELLEIDTNNELTKLVRRRTATYGVYILRVQISDFTRCLSIRHLTNPPPVLSGILRG